MTKKKTPMFNEDLIMEKIEYAKKDNKKYEVVAQDDGLRSECGE